MSVFDNSNFFPEFPFSPSRLRHVQPRPPVTTASQPCKTAIAADLPEVAGPAPDAMPDAAVPGSAPPAIRMPAPQRPALRSLRTPPPPVPLRMLPLATFIWGSRALPPQPRTRADHALIWVTSGRLQLDYPRRHQTLRPGDLRLIPAGTAFAALPMQDARGHVALIPADLAALAGLPAAGLAAHVGAQAAHLLRLLTALASASGARDAGRTADLAALLPRCLATLDPERAPAAAPQIRTGDRDLVERFLTLARASLRDCLSLAELSGQLHCATAALDSACLAARGRRAIELIHDLRLECAAGLLRQGRLPTTQIARQAGYSSQTHFTRAFVAATGRTPEAFRAQPC
ncbi:helix-turn-helix transcriptional regulator [Paracoccus spongiarum]|uniref:AraC family transcriptional regulator n=1 Tax=Paracoccus spongiarum TaxID=3064387 RepID=A0ABT9JD92_9RHOB|nr:AraC family transcriptional regulator [Paracoccus sp. 2205BS29-5]MDP5307780.1 AraC family transcriptional regulator [Paracoccus sp. 2205BS29-5]